MAPLNRLKGWIGLLSQTKLAKYLTIIMAIVCCQQLAQLSWSLISSASSANNKLVSPFSDNRSDFSQSTKNDVSMLAGIKELALFGKVSVEQAHADTTELNTDPAMYDSLPVARLNARLAGIVSSEQQELALAIFEQNRLQAGFGVGDRIEDARIVHIFADQVIVNRQGRNEIIPLFDDENLNGRNKKSTASPTKTNDKNATAITQAKDALNEGTASILDYVSISPVMVGDTLTGYRLNPGADPALFNEVGLKSNDLAIAINGYDLRDDKEAQKVMQEVSTMTSLSITVAREGQIQEIQIMLDEE